MKKYFYIWFVIFIFFSCSETKKNRIIGITLLASDPPTELCKDGIIKALEDRGFKKGKNITLLEKNAEGDFAAVNKITKKFVEEKVDLAIALSTISLKSLIDEKVTFPVIFSSVANPFIIGAGITDSMHHPLVTGVPSTAPIKETIQIIKELFPEVNRIGTLYTPSEPNSVYYASVQKNEALKNKIYVKQVPINDVSDISQAMDSLINSGIKVIYQISDVLTASSFDSIVIKANSYKIPIICNQIVQVNAGAILGLCLDFYKLGYETGLITADVLEGKNPSSIPFKRLNRMILSVNTKAANKLNVKLSDEFLRKANKIIH